MKNIFVGILFVVCFSLFVPKANSQCSMCENMITIIESWAEANNTITAMEAKLDMLCSLVPAFENVCDGIVDFDVKGVVGYLERNGDANTVCKKIGVCGGLKLKESNRKLNDEGYCYYCEYFFGALESIVSTGAGEDEVSGYLEVLCSAFPNEQICKFGIVNLSPMVFQYLTAVADPSTICYDVGICSYPGDDWDEDGEEDPEDDEEYASQHAGSDDDWDDDGDWKMKRAVTSKLHPDDTCTYCAILVGWLTSYIESDAGVNEAKYILENYICSITQNISPICNTLIEEMELVFQFAAAQESSQNICYKLNMCQSGDDFSRALREVVKEL